MKYYCYFQNTCCTLLRCLWLSYCRRRASVADIKLLLGSNLWFILRHFQKCQPVNLIDTTFGVHNLKLSQFCCMPCCTNRPKIFENNTGVCHKMRKKSCHKNGRLCALSGLRACSAKFTKLLTENIYICANMNKLVAKNADIGACESAVCVRIEYESNRALRFEFESNLESNKLQRILNSVINN